MRLRNISEVLHQYICRGENFITLFNKTFFYCRKELNIRLKSMSFTDNVPKFVSETEFPKKEAYKEASEYYDEKYFSYEDSGDQGVASIYFSFARLASALAYFYKGISVDNIEEAMYEIIMSTEDPKYTVQNIEDNLDNFIL